jgi:microcin C transport system substrate-binding protein
MKPNMKLQAASMIGNRSDRGRSRSQVGPIFGALLLAAILAGCGKKDAATNTAGANPTAASAAAAAFPGMEADLARTVKEQAGFYVFKTPADFAAETQGLKWEDGADLPEFADPNAKKGGTVRIWQPDYPPTFRTLGPDSNTGFRGYLLDDVAMGFIGSHPNLPGSYFPGLATSWAVARATKTAYFRINPDARWSDGHPITTDDVVFTFYLMRSPLLNDPWSNDFYTKSYTKITVYDPLTFSVTLPELKPDILDRTGGWVPYPRHAFADFGPGWVEKFQWRFLPTTAPYVLKDEDIVKGQSITFTRLQDWWAKDLKFWRGRFNPDKLRLVVIRDPDKAFEAFRKGDLEFFGLGTPTLWYEKLADTDELVTKGYVDKAKFFNRTPQPDWGLWLNESKPPLDNRDLREGIHYATNFQLVCDQYFRGDAVVQQTRSDGFGWRTHPTLTARPFDPAKAREFFAKAGYTKQGPDGVLRNAAGDRLSLRILAGKRPGTDDILSILKQEALKAGLEFQIDIEDPTTAFEITAEKNHEIGYEAFNIAPELYPRYWETYAGENAYDKPYLPDGVTPNPARKAKPETNNLTSTAVPALDALIKRYDQAESLDEIKALTIPIEEQIDHDAAWVHGWAQPFIRLGYWRWVKWPEGFNPMQARDAIEMYVFSIDPDAEKETVAAKAAGKTFPPVIKVYDQYKQK